MSVPRGRSTSFTVRSPRWSDCWWRPSSEAATGALPSRRTPTWWTTTRWTTTGKRGPHERRLDDRGRRHHDVPDAGRTEHPGPPGRAGHPGRGDDVRHRHLGRVQPGFDGEL